MKIEFTEHAKSRMKYRQIKKHDIEATILDPYFTVPSKLGRYIVVKKAADKYLKVICERSNDKITVITAYWTRRP